MYDLRRNVTRDLFDVDGMMDVENIFRIRLVANQSSLLLYETLL